MEINTSTTMNDQAVACRSCLLMDVKLFNIFVYNLAESFSDLTGTQVFPCDGLPQHLCGCCIALLRRLVAFRNMVQTTERLMVEAVVSENKVTPDFIRSIDRKTNNLPLPFTVTQVFTCSNIDKNEIKPIDLEDIKQEDPITQDSDNESNYIFMEDDSKSDSKNTDYFPPADCLKELGNIAVFETNVEIKKAKETKKSKKKTKKINKSEVDVHMEEGNFEIDFPRYPQVEQESNRNQLEDITVFDSNVDIIKDKNTKKNKKDTKKTKKITKKTRKSNKPEVNDELPDTSETEFPKEQHVFKRTNRKKRKLNQPKWFEVDEQKILFEKNHNVEVKILTKEEQIEEFQSRKLTRNYKLCPYTCDKCYRGFELETAYRNHLMLHDKSRGNVECDICGVVHRLQSKMKRHVLQHKLRIRCKECNYTTSCDDLAIEHYKMHNGHLFKCEHCDKGFRRKCNYSAHVRLLHPSTQLSCDICGEGFNGKLGLTVHRRVHKIAEVEEAGNNRCVTCNVVYRSPEALRAHSCDPTMRSCVECGAQFGTERELRDHRRHHLQYKCDACDMRFPSEASCSVHYDRIHLNVKRKDPRHGGLKPVGDGRRFKRPLDYAARVCEFCGKMFASQAALDYHRRMHTGEKPYECDVCYKRFRTSLYLKYHMPTHTGEKPYKCKLCPKSFGSPSVLYTHQRVHTGARPYTCSACGKSFTQSNSMKLHVRTVHMKLPPPYKRRRRNQNDDE